MFSIEATGNLQLNTQLKGQFHPFAKEGGKLPSFSACLHPLSEMSDLPALKTQLGDYNFFEPAENGYWLSFCESFMRVDIDFIHADVYQPAFSDDRSAYEASYLLMQAYMFRLAMTDGFMIHAAAVVHQGQGILFCGQSGAGKSTQANLWKKHLHCEILNYDKPCILQENGRFFAHGSPWSGKERVIKNECVPLRAIVYVVQAKQNRVTRFSPAQAMSRLFLHNYVYPITPQVEKQYVAVLRAVAVNVPVFELACDMSEAAVETLFAALFPTQVYSEAKKENCMKYKVKDSFQMKEIAEEFIVIPRGAGAVDFNAAVVFNEAGAFLWGLLTSPTEEAALAKALVEKYGIDDAVAAEDAHAFLEKMKQNDLLDITD